MQRILSITARQAGTRALLAVLALLLLAPAASAQESLYKYDLGGSIGMSGYLGDANSTPLIKHPGFTAEANGRYIHNARLALRGVLGATTLSGNTADMDNALPGGASYKFTSTVVSLDARFEFNFLPYGIGETYKRLSRWTPYLTLGLGGCLSASGGNMAVAPTLPMGAGVKYKLRERLNLCVEFTMTKTFSDKIDGADIHDLAGIKTSFFKNTDWFSRLTVGLTFEFGERCQTCHYVD